MKEWLNFEDFPQCKCRKKKGKKNMSANKELTETCLADDNIPIDNK